MNITKIMSTFKKYVRGRGKELLLCAYMCLFGVMCAMWRDLWINETANTLTAFSLFISIVALFISNYFVVENAIESRSNNKKKLFSEYCARFSSNQNYCKVVEWLMCIAEFDSNVYPNRLNDEKGGTISEPTFFQKKCFWDFLIELNIQIKNKQLEKEDVRKLFYPYALIFKKVLQAENNKGIYMWNFADQDDDFFRLFTESSESRSDLSAQEKKP